MRANLVAIDMVCAVLEAKPDAEECSVVGFELGAIQVLVNGYLELERDIPVGDRVPSNGPDERDFVAAAVRERKTGLFSSFLVPPPHTRLGADGWPGVPSHERPVADVELDRDDIARLEFLVAFPEGLPEHL